MLHIKTNKSFENIKSFLASISALFIIFFFSGTLSPLISKFVQSGIKLCFTSIIGSVFPFLILTDILTSMAGFDRIDWLRRLFERLFKINGCAIFAFVAGISCGFPIGVKVARDMYENGGITKEECERLIGFCNNSGPAFVISAIGCGMRGSLADGVILYISTISAAVICGILFGIGKTPSKSRTLYQKTSFSLSSSIKNAGISTLNISSFIITFSVICGIVSLVIKNELLYSFLVPFIEIGNASYILSHTLKLSSRTSLVLTAFALSFSGASVHMQARSFLEDINISMKKYYLMKLLQGVFASVLCLVILHIR